MTSTTAETKGNVSRKCANGDHHRCLGTVAVYPPIDGHTLVPCECTVEGCNHGPAAARK